MEMMDKREAKAASKMEVIDNEEEETSRDCDKKKEPYTILEMDTIERFYFANWRKVDESIRNNTPLKGFYSELKEALGPDCTKTKETLKSFHSQNVTKKFKILEAKGEHEKLKALRELGFKGTDFYFNAQIDIPNIRKWSEYKEEVDEQSSNMIESTPIKLFIQQGGSERGYHHGYSSRESKRPASADVDDRSIDLGFAQTKKNDSLQGETRESTEINVQKEVNDNRSAYGFFFHQTQEPTEDFNPFPQEELQKLDEQEIERFLPVPPREYDFIFDQDLVYEPYFRRIDHEESLI